MSVQRIYQVETSLASRVASLTRQVQQLTNTVAAISTQLALSQGNSNANTRETLYSVFYEFEQKKNLEIHLQ